MDKHHKLLFERRALVLSPADEPFWYTSGTFGPYYINTHYLLGGEEKAKALLSILDDPRPEHLINFRSEVLRALEEDTAYAELMHEAAEPYGSFDYISGGARRDFYFSFAVAAILNKPHLGLLKDGRSYRMEDGRCKALPETFRLEGSVLHVADLLTAGSSYLRAWIPALRKHGLNLQRTLVLVDRDQGGRSALAEEGVEARGIMTLDEAFFREAQAEGYLSGRQLQRILEFRRDPRVYMRRFLAEHPEFLQAALAGKPVVRERAERYLALQEMERA